MIGLKNYGEKSTSFLGAYGRGLLWLAAPILGVFGWRLASDLYTALKKRAGFGE